MQRDKYIKRQDTIIIILSFLLAFIIIFAIQTMLIIKPQLETCVSNPESVFHISTDDEYKTLVRIDYCNEDNRVSNETIDIEDTTTVQDYYKESLKKLDNEKINQILEKEYKNQ